MSRGLMAGFNFLFDFALVFIVNSIHISVGAVSNRTGTQHVPYVLENEPLDSEEPNL